MRGLILGLLILLLLAVPANAVDFVAPEVPQSAIDYMPDDTQNFGQGLLFVIQEAVRKVQPGFTEAIGICASVMGVTIAIGMLSCFFDKKDVVFELAGTVTSGMVSALNRQIVIEAFYMTLIQTD